MRLTITLLFLVCIVTAQAQPVITTHPKGQSDISGATIALNVSVTGAGVLRYQWRKDTSPLTDKTNAWLLVTNFSSPDAGDYDVIVTNLSGGITSSVATLTLDAGYLFTTLVGSPTDHGSFDGVGGSARFSGNFRGIAVDHAGYIYVAEAGPKTIRKISPAGVVSTLAGMYGVAGSVDGTNNTARFGLPTGLAVDSAGNVFVADYLNQTIRKISQAGIVTTLAGKVGVSGRADGTGTNATFVFPNGLALDSSGNIYVTHYEGPAAQKLLRRITQGGAVSTLSPLFSAYMAGLAVDAGGNLFVAEETGSRIWRVSTNGSASVFAATLSGPNYETGYADGFGAAARFKNPWGVAFDAGFNLIVVDRQNHAIRRITTNGVVSTLGGLGGSSGSADGEGSEARFNSPWSVAVDSAGALYVADGNGTIRKGIRYTGVPFITTQPLCQAVPPGSNVTFSITVTSAVPVSCQWQFQGTDIPGETNTSLTLTNVQLGNVGNYRAFVTNALGSDASVYASLGILGQPVSILDGDGIQYATDGLHLQLNGLVGQGQIVVYASTNLTAWEAIYTNYAGFGSLGFIDPGATNFSQRFYRASVSGVP